MWLGEGGAKAALPLPRAAALAKAGAFLKGSEPAMAAIGLIVLFLVVIGALNFYEFKRID